MWEAALDSALRFLQALKVFNLARLSYSIAWSSCSWEIKPQAGVLVGAPCVGRHRAPAWALPLGSRQALVPSSLPVSGHTALLFWFCYTAGKFLNPAGSIKGLCWNAYLADFPLLGLTPLLVMGAHFNVFMVVLFYLLSLVRCSGN